MEKVVHPIVTDAVYKLIDNNVCPSVTFPVDTQPRTTKKHSFWAFLFWLILLFVFAHILKY